MAIAVHGVVFATCSVMLARVETPGWFAWPRPIGFLLVYTAWFLSFLAASLAARSLRRSRKAVDD